MVMIENYRISVRDWRRKLCASMPQRMCAVLLGHALARMPQLRREWGRSDDRQVARDYLIAAITVPAFDTRKCINRRNFKDENHCLSALGAVRSIRLGYSLH